MALEDSPLKALSLDLLSLLANGQAFSDVTFEVEGRHVYAHRCVLAARSPFFRMIFCGDAQLHNGAQPRLSTPQIIPVGIVGYEVFMLLLQFLYSGNFSFSPQNSARGCKDKSCWHTHCSSAVEFGLETLNAAQFFGVDQLSALTQKHLGAMAEKASIEDVMRMLAAARKQDGDPHLWTVCSKLVGKSGLSLETLQKHLPPEVVTEIELIRQKAGYGYETSISGSGISEQRTKRMQKALDSSDVELVKLMVMGEGLNLDKAFALHYAISSCSRKVVKTLLDLGAANVNLQGLDARTPLHLAAQLGDPEKIAMLLDHHADPHTQTATGATAMDIVQSGIAEVLSAGGYNTKGDQNRLRLCQELLERAIATTLPMHVKSTRVDSGSPASILTEHGSSTLIPGESDNFQVSTKRIMGTSPHGGLLGNADFYGSLSQGHSSQGKVRGREILRGESSESISRILNSSPIAYGFPEEQELQAESRTLTSNNYSNNYSVMTTSSFGDRPQKHPRLNLTDSKDLPSITREVVLKDITNEGLESFKNSLTPNFAEEEVSSGWQLFLQEHSETHKQEFTP